MSDERNPDQFCAIHTWPEPGNVSVALAGLQIQACTVCGALRGVPVPEASGVGLRIG